MPESSSLLFASSNRHKFEEARDILAAFGVELNLLRCQLEEIQSYSILDIAERKSAAAFALCGKPVIAEDAALHIDSLGGFPGPYSSYVFATIGNAGILKLVGRSRSARFASAVAYCDGAKPVSFCAAVSGRISDAARGRGWGYDPIFIPRGETRTYAQMPDKNTASHRHASLRKLARWLRTRE